jgi:hypothetical protein
LGTFSHLDGNQRDPSAARVKLRMIFLRRKLTTCFLGAVVLGALVIHAAELTNQHGVIPEKFSRGQSAFDAASTHVKLPTVLKPSVEFHVAPGGDDSATGSAAQPFQSVEAARDAIRALKKQRALPAGGVGVVLHGGNYPVKGTLALGTIDSGAADAPIVYRAAEGETPVFSGGMPLRGFQLTRDEAVLKRLPVEARGKVFEVNLRGLGVNILPLQLGGFGSGRGFKSHPVMELFFDDEPLQLARWPNDGFISISNISTNDGHSIHGFRGSRTGVFNYDSDRPQRWSGEKDVRLYGYWFWDWADSYEKVARIDPTKREITIEAPFHTYGYRKGQKFYAINLLSEIDRPGEWFLDRDSGVLYVWPPSDPNKARVEISAAPFAFVELNDVSHVRFEGFTWKLGSADAITIKGGEGCVLAGCKVQQFAGSGISINSGKRHVVLSCDVHSLGRGGIRVSGGDRKTLTGANHIVENCHIFNLSRIDHTYTPAVQVSGVGQRIAHNLMHEIRSSAINLGGNDHLVELNEAGHVVQESDDQGAVDMWGNPTFRGNVFRWNYFHHIGPWENARTEPALGQAGIRLDDAISGVLIYGNVFRHAATGKHGFGGVQIHGGHENIIDGNVFVDCAQAVSFSPWASARWIGHVEKFVGEKEINWTLYTNRYPDLALLRTNVNVNHLWRNQFVNCERVLRQNRAARLAENREMKQSSAIEACLMSFPIESRPGELRDIPVGEIGMYSDPWRPALPVALIRRLRSDK